MATITSSYATSAPSTVGLTSAWIKNPTVPAQNMTVNVRSIDPTNRSGNETVFWPLAEVDPVVVSSVRRKMRGSITLLITLQSEIVALDVLFNSGNNLLFQKPLESTLGPVTSFYFRLAGETSMGRVMQPAGRPEREFTFAFSEVSGP